jgi:hypothetical protein
MTWLFLLVAASLIAPLSLFVHDFMLERLKVPYPKTVGLPISITFLNEIVRFGALAAICRLSRPQLDGIPRVAAAFAAGLLLAMLNETLRVFLIESAIIGNGLYSVFDIAPRALSSFAGGFAIVWIALGDQRRRNLALAAILIAALVAFAVHPALDALCASLKSSLPEPAPLYSDPYPFKINVLIYATFIEPTIVAFVMIAFCWPALGASLLRRILVFAVLLLLVRGRFVELFVESFWVRQPLPTAFLAESQFFFETLTLGLLVALAWNYAAKVQCKVGREREGSAGGGPRFKSP